MAKYETMTKSEDATCISGGKNSILVENQRFLISESVVKPSYFAPLPMNKFCEAVSCPLTSPVTGKCLMSRHLAVTVMSDSHLLDFLLAITVQITLHFAI